MQVEIPKAKIEELCRSMCRWCRNDYKVKFNRIMGNWEHPYAVAHKGEKFHLCDATPMRGEEG